MTEQVKPEEQKTSSKGKGFVITIIILLAVIGAVVFAMKQGLIPGLENKESQVASELKKDVESLKGPAMGEKLVSLLAGYVDSDEYLTDQEKQETKKALGEMKDNLGISLDYKEIKDVESQDGIGTIEINAPKLFFSSKEDNESGYGTFSSIKVSRSVEDPNHYFYRESGDLSIYSSIAGNDQKLFAINYSPETSELKINDEGEIIYSKGRATNIEFIEGKSGMVLARVAEAKSEQKLNSEDGITNAAVIASYNGIEAGQMVKMMIGQIDPISINVDYSYNGDEFMKLIQGLEDLNEGRLDKFTRALQGEKINEEESELIDFAGDLKLNNFSLLMANSGLKFSGEINMNGSKSLYPYGEAKVVLAGYDYLINLARRFMPLPENDVAKAIEFMKAVGEEKGDDIVFNIVLNGTENFTVGGKTIAEIEEIQNKILAPKVEQGSLEDDFQFQQNAIEVPEVATKELPSG